MAKTVLRDCIITVDGDDISDHASEVTVEWSADEVEVTAFGSTNKEMLKGLGDATITVTVFQDFASNEIDQNMWVHSQETDPFEVTVKATSAATSATNPEFSLPAALLFNYKPLAGSVGEASTTELVFRNAGPLGLVRSFS